MELRHSPFAKASDFANLSFIASSFAESYGGQVSDGGGYVGQDGGQVAASTSRASHLSPLTSHEPGQRLPPPGSALESSTGEVIVKVS